MTKPSEAGGAQKRGAVKALTPLPFRGSQSH